MPDFRVADTAPEHPKLRAAGLSGFGLWSAAGGYCMLHLTDGWVPEYWVLTWPGAKAAARRLIEVGLWVEEKGPLGQPGYRFRDFLDYQRSAAQIEEERERGRERAAKSRRARGVTHQQPVAEAAGIAPGTVLFGDSSGERAANVQRESQVESHDSLSLTQELTQPDQSGTSSVTRDDLGAGLPFPDGWTPHDGHRRSAARRKVDLGHQAEQFEAHARAHGRRAVDWDAAFTVWLGTTRPGAAGPNAWSAARKGGTDANIADLIQRGYDDQRPAIEAGS